MIAVTAEAAMTSTFAIALIIRRCTRMNCTLISIPSIGSASAEEGEENEMGVRVATVSSATSCPSLVLFGKADPSRFRREPGTSNRWHRARSYGNGTTRQPPSVASSAAAAEGKSWFASPSRSER